MLPAGGMLNFAEASSGCVCLQYKLQTSFSLMSTDSISASSWPVKSVRPAMTMHTPVVSISVGKFIKIMVDNVDFGNRLRVLINDVSGTRFFEKTTVSSGINNIFEWKYEKAKKGMYFATIKTNKGIVSKKILIF